MPGRDSVRCLLPRPRLSALGRNMAAARVGVGGRAPVSVRGGPVPARVVVLAPFSMSCVRRGGLVRREGARAATLAHRRPRVRAVAVGGWLAGGRASLRLAQGCRPVCRAVPVRMPAAGGVPPCRAATLLLAQCAASLEGAVSATAQRAVSAGTVPTVPATAIQRAVASSVYRSISAALKRSVPFRSFLSHHTGCAVPNDHRGRCRLVDDAVVHLFAGFHKATSSWSCGVHSSTARNADRDLAAFLESELPLLKQALTHIAPKTFLVVLPTPDVEVVFREQVDPSATAHACPSLRILGGIEHGHCRLRV
mmetsp:Transcript_43728/g.110255  ORF Transcript_43728/g.110255 Transcript_43728/m.110255 type:complete len:309 (+) Transcript_43728:1282-2208(+)